MNSIYENYTRDELIKEIDALKNRKKLGLVWEDNPENVILRCQRELPVLEEVKSLEISKDENLPTNLLIEGDNYHSLSVLNYTHAGKIDVIYIDPPYNTGAKDWIYNNDYVDSNDGFRHSKWLSMMANRLRLAKNLLSSDGIICVAIDHYELFNLGCLMDNIFGEKNRIGTICIRHHPRGRTQSNFFSTTHEYSLFYGKDISQITTDFRFAENSDEEEVSFIRSRGDSFPEKRPNLFYPIFYNPNTKEIKLDKENNDFIEILPENNNGMRIWSLVKESFLQELQSGKIFVKKNKNSYQVFRRIVREKFKATTMWTDARYDANNHGTKILKKIFNNKKDKMFDFPKSIYTVLDILKITTKKDSIVLDFFAGSGTTGHAVSLLNKEDGGNRQFILCNKNEDKNDDIKISKNNDKPKIAREVCYPRIKAVINGHKNLPKITGISSNLRYFKTRFVSSNKTPTDKDKSRLAKKAKDMLCVKENTFTQIEIGSPETFEVFCSQNRYMVIIHNEKSISEFKKYAKKINGVFAVYIFSFDDDDFSDEFANIGEINKFQIHAIPEAILQVYQRIHGVQK